MYIAAGFQTLIPTLDPKIQNPKTLSAINKHVFSSAATPFPRYEVGRAPNGGVLSSAAIMSRWYPEQQAQLLAIYRLPPSTRQLYNNMKANLFSSVPKVVRRLTS